MPEHALGPLADLKAENADLRIAHLQEELTAQRGWYTEVATENAELRAVIEAMYDGEIYLSKLHPSETWTCAYNHSLVRSSWTPGLPTPADAALAGLAELRKETKP